MRSSCFGFLQTSRRKRHLWELKTRLWPPPSLLASFGPLRFLSVSQNKMAPTTALFPGCSWNPGTSLSVLDAIQKVNTDRKTKAFTKLDKGTALKVKTTTAMPSLPGSHTEDHPPTGIILTPCTTLPEFRAVSWSSRTQYESCAQRWHGCELLLDCC